MFLNPGPWRAIDSHAPQWVALLQPQLAEFYIGVETMILRIFIWLYWARVVPLMTMTWFEGLLLLWKAYHSICTSPAMIREPCITHWTALALIQSWLAAFCRRVNDHNTHLRVQLPWADVRLQHEPQTLCLCYVMIVTAHVLEP